MKKRGFTLIELGVIIVILFMLFGLAYFITNHLLEKSRMKSLNITANNVRKAMESYHNINRIPSGISTYDMLSRHEAAKYISLTNDPWNNKFQKLQTIVYRDGLYTETNVYLKILNHGCFYLLDGTNQIIPYTCDLDPTKHGLYTKVHIKNLASKWQTSDIVIMVSTQEYVKGLPLKLGGTAVCYIDNQTTEKCIDTDKRGKANITIKDNGIHELNIYGKNKNGYSVDKDTLIYTVKLDKTIPEVLISPNEVPLVCAVNNQVNTKVLIKPLSSTSGIKYRYRIANNGIWGSWSTSTTSEQEITLKELGRNQIKVESTNGVGKVNVQTSGYYLLEGPIVKVIHSPNSIILPYSGNKSLKLTYQCLSGVYGLTNCAYKFSDENGSANSYNNNYVMSLNASNTLVVQAADFMNNHYLWIKPVSNSVCANKNIMVKTQVFE